MKHILTIATLSLCGLPFAFADEAIQPDIKADHGKAPWNAPLPAGEPQIVRPIGRVPVEGVKPETEAIPPKYADEKSALMTLESVAQSDNDLGLLATIRIINPTDAPITFTGYSEKSPITKQQQWVEGKWVDEQRFLRCGTGLRDCVIPPGQSAVFQVGIVAEKLPARIGVECNVKGPTGMERRTFWSEKIVR